MHRYNRECVKGLESSYCVVHFKTFPYTKMYITFWTVISNFSISGLSISFDLFYTNTTSASDLCPIWEVFCIQAGIPRVGLRLRTRIWDEAGSARTNNSGSHRLHASSKWKAL